MLIARGVSGGYETSPLFTGLDLTLNPGDRVGIVGPNGSGKTTLLKIFSGELPPSEGSIVSNAAIGVLPQIPDSNSLVGEYIDGAMNGVFTKERELHALYDEMANPQIKDGPDVETLYAQVAQKQAEMDMLDGWTAQGRADEMLETFGLPEDVFDRTFGELSGGQQAAVCLAAHLLLKPRILLLDEPTNNLDVDTLEKLEAIVKDFDGAVVMVSHDREFLDRTASSILAIEGGGRPARQYTGNYSDYMDTRSRQMRRLMLDVEAARKSERRIEASIALQSARSTAIERSTVHHHYRARAARIARQATVTKKRLERGRPVSVTDIYGEPEDLKFKLPAVKPPQHSIVRATNLSLAYSGRVQAIKDASFEILGRDRVAVTGRNGSGKTTLLRAIGNADFQGLEKRGDLYVSNNLGHITQSDGLVEARASNDSVLGWFRKKVPLHEQEALSMLIWFGFGKRLVERKNGLQTISPGEYAKLSLISLSYGGYEGIVMDEPTNHLDIPSLEVVEEVLAAYGGAIIVASHDRKFLENIGIDHRLSIRNGAVDFRQV